MDVWKQKKIGYEATIRGYRGGHTVSAQKLFEDAMKNKAVEQLDYNSRDMSIKSGLDMLDESEKLFVNITSQSISNMNPWFCSDAPVDQIVLEITEQIPIHAGERVKMRLQELREKGMQLALDDFGNGFTNLILIEQLRPEYLKLDKIFSNGLLRTSSKKDVIKVIRGIIRLCEESGVQLIVEGVETIDQREQLLDLGVRYMQGFYFGYPEPSMKNHLPHSI